MGPREGKMVRAKFEGELVRGLNRKQSQLERRAANLHKSKNKKKGSVKKVRTKKVTKKKRALEPWKPRYWTLEDQSLDCPLRKRRKKGKHTIAKLRASITPGTVLILLAGLDKGSRCVFLKQLSSGLLLVVGPYKVNGIPLRRACHTMVIATSMKLDLSKCTFWKALKNVDDVQFMNAKVTRNKAKAVLKKKDFFSEEDGEPKKKHAPVNGLTREMHKLSKLVDREVIHQMSKVPNLRRYVSTKFRLTNHTHPHLMKF